jgi:error-prone DNA polymerase
MKGKPVRYVEFAVASNFSFLRGASHPEQLISQASHLGLSGLGLCDRNTVAGVVRAHVTRRENPENLTLAYHPGARLVFADGTPDILAYPRDRAAWGRLCRLLTRGNLRAEKGECILTRDDLIEHAEGLELIVMPVSTRAAPAAFLHRKRQSYADEMLRAAPVSDADSLLSARPRASGDPETAVRSTWIPAGVGTSGMAIGSESAPKSEELRSSRSRRHCEQSEIIQSPTKDGLLRRSAPRNDGSEDGGLHPRIINCEDRPVGTHNDGPAPNDDPVQSEKGLVPGEAEHPPYVPTGLNHPSLRVQQSNPEGSNPEKGAPEYGLLRRFAPRNDGRALRNSDEAPRNEELERSLTPEDSASHPFRLPTGLNRPSLRANRPALRAARRQALRSNSEAHGKGWIASSASPPRDDDSSQSGKDLALLVQLNAAAPGRVRLAAMVLYRGNDRARLAARAALARRARVPLIAVNDVLYHDAAQRALQDVLTCIREHVTIDTAGRRLAANAERHLKSAHEMARLFADCPDAIDETLRLDAALTFSLDELKYEYPDESVKGFATSQAALEHLTWEGARQRYPKEIPATISKNLAREFELIAARNYAPYFLTVYDIVRYARSRGILCQGRGSAANSTVCYCLGVTPVDPDKNDLLFDRFISADRDEPPDIDVDFEHERREEVIQYLYGKYGRERAGIAATVISYRGRSAIREVGKVFGLSEDRIGALASSIWGMGGGNVRLDALCAAGLDPQEARIAKIVALTQAIRGFPRHLSQHVGGFVITRSRLDEVVPIMNGGMDARTHVEWDKDDLDALGILKVDVLGLGMLTCIRKAFELAKMHYGISFEVPAPPHDAQGNEAVVGYDLALVPNEEKEAKPVYDMLCRADSIGVFQVESRAQMSMLPRLKPREFYDLVIEVAIVRPGPIQGNMVHPYLRRREAFARTGKEPDYPSPAPGKGDPDELKRILKKTLGVPLFQEQAMRIAIDAGGFTPSEADKLRRAMATFKRTGTIGTFRDKMIGGMTEKGYPRDFAERCFSQIEGFGEYGFPQSHAASFAILVYVSAWLKCRYPDVFAAALLNAQPMGFYASAQIVRDVREHGVAVRPPDINVSSYDSTLEDGPAAAARLHSLHAEMRDDIRARKAIRLGLREINGHGEDSAKIIVGRRGEGYASVRDLWVRTGLDIRVLERLADADAFGSLGLTRRQALWAVKALGRAGDQDMLPLFAAAASASANAHSGQVDRSPPAHPCPRSLSGVNSSGNPLEAEAWVPACAGTSGSEAPARMEARMENGTGCASPPPQAGEVASASEAGGGKPHRHFQFQRRWPSPQSSPASGGGRIDKSASGGGGFEDTASGSERFEELARGGGFDERTSGSEFGVLRIGEFVEPAVSLPPMLPGEEVINDYRFLSLSLRAHPASFLRADLAARRIATNDTLRTRRSGACVTVSGLVTIRQRPGSANGVVFMTLEDETAIANVIVWPDVFERFRPLVLGARYVAVSGRLQHVNGVIHVVADRLDDLTRLLARLTDDRPQGHAGPALPSSDEDIAADLGVHARGSAHTPSRRGGTMAMKRLR